MSPRIRLLLIILSVSLNVAFIAAWGMKTMTQKTYAAKQEPSLSCSRDSCGVWCPLHRALGTTDEQWRTLEPLQRRFKTASAPFSFTMDSLRAVLSVQLAQSPVDRIAVEATQEQILGVQRQMQSLVVNHLLEEKPVLTAAQQEKLFSLMKGNGICAGYGGMMDGQGGKNCPRKNTHDVKR
jgi:hypothetical protein